MKGFGNNRDDSSSQTLNQYYLAISNKSAKQMKGVKTFPQNIHKNMQILRLPAIKTQLFKSITLKNSFEPEAFQIISYP